MQAASQQADPAAESGGLGGTGPGGGSLIPGTVAAVLVVHNGEPWLPRTLAALTASTRRPERIIAVDSGSTDASGELLAECAAVEQVLHCPVDTGFGAAVRLASRELAGSRSGAPEWLWLLHDDSAPEPAALSSLLAEASRTGAAVLGPKLRGWHDPGLLLECGLSATASGRRFTGLQVGDRDQGQRDDASQVLAVGSAGMLVRAQVWDEFDGFDPALPMFGDDIEFCIRVRRGGHTVAVAPEAVVHHREAATHGVRTGALLAPMPGVAARSASLYTRLVHGPALLLPLTSLLLLFRCTASAAILLLTAGPRRAWAELRVWGGVHLHPAQVVRARRRVRRIAQVPRRDLRPFLPRRSEQLAAALDHHTGQARSSGRGDAERAPIDLGAALAMTACLAVVAAIATRGVWSSSGPLAGGALLPAADGTTLWTNFRASWHDVGLGSSEPAAPYPLFLLLAGVLPGITVEYLTQTILLGSVPLAGLSAFLALRGLSGRGGRVALAVAYALVPVGAVPALDGRLGTAVPAILLPWLVRLLVRIYKPQGLVELPPARLRTAATAALVLAALTAFAPLIWVAAAAGVLLAAMIRARTRVRWVWTLVVLVGPPVVLYPWSWAVASDPSRMLFEAGVTSPRLVAETPPGWRLLLLDPGTLGPLVLPLAAGLAAVALLALLFARSRRLAVWGWLLVAIGALGATVQTSQQFLPLGATTAQYGFAGPMLQLMAVGMLLAAAALLSRVGRPERARQRVMSMLATAALVTGPVVMAGVWISELTGPLSRNDTTLVPAFVAEEAKSSVGVRTLLLAADGRGAVAYTLVNGAGTRLGDADVAPPADTWRETSAAVAGVVAGVGPAPVAVLAAQAVGYIVADSADAELAAALDGNSALRRLSTVDGRGLWRTIPPASRARLAGSAGATEVGILTAAERGSSGRYLEAALTTGTDDVLLIAQHNDGKWLASVDGRPVPIPTGGPLTVPLPAERAVAVAVARDQEARDRTLLVPLAGLLILLVLLLPSGQRADPDPDAEADR